MQAIIAASGGVKDENILKKSWRSRPDIVHAVNAIFSKAFTNLPPEQVVLEPAFTSEAKAHFSDAGVPGLALQHWHFVSEADERKTPGSPWFEQCIADQISIFLDRKPLIYNKKRDEIYVKVGCQRFKTFWVFFVFGSQKSCWNKIRVNWLAFVTFLRGRGGKTWSFSTPPMCRKLINWHEEENVNLKKKKSLKKRRVKLCILNRYENGRLPIVGHGTFILIVIVCFNINLPNKRIL